MILVDAYNVLGVQGVLDGARTLSDVRSLVGLIAGSRLAGQRVILVCDGNPPRNAPQGLVRGIEVVYAGTGHDADGEISRRLRASSAPRRALVVSSDRAVRTEARKLGAKEISSEQFLEGLCGRDRATRVRQVGPRDAVPLPPGVVREWIEEFGLRASDLMEIAGAAATPRAAREQPPSRVEKPAARAASAQTPEPLGDDLRALLARLAPTLDPSNLDMRRWIDGVERRRDE
ncbi:MAG: NYN domain-containing protein [Phycisphaerales bacterium]